MSAAPVIALPPDVPCVELRCPRCDANRLAAKYWPRVFAGRVADRWRLSCGACRWSRFMDEDPNMEAAR